MDQFYQDNNTKYSVLGRGSLYSWGSGKAARLWSWMFTAYNMKLKTVWSCTSTNHTSSL